MGSCEEIGARVKACRERAELTQEQLAHHLSVSRETVNQWERGARDMKTGYVIALSERLNVSCDYLLTGVDTPSIDVCKTTLLTQDSIDVLTRYADEDEARAILGASADSVIPARRYIVNTLLQDEEFINDISGAASIAASASNDDSNGHMAPASQYVASMAFGRFFEKFVDNESLVDEITKYIDKLPDGRR